jgi:proteasome accessory factor B
VDSAERLINLALFLAGSRTPVTAEGCRAAGLGYPEGQDAPAFGRMFERDKDVLRAAGLPIEVDRAGETEAYRLEPAAYAAPVHLSAEELAALAATGAAMLADPSFPLTDDLRYALAKLTAFADTPAPAVAARLADEAPEAQGEAAAALASAVTARKRVTFGYTNLAGRSGTREVEPYAIFLREGRWYLVGRDTSRDEVRTYTLARMTELSANAERPKSADFERPEGFDVAAYVLLPFQYGPAERTATVRFAPEAAWRAERVTARQGTLECQADGAVLWRVPVADPDRLVRWIVENGPGVTPVDADLRALLVEGLRKVVELHAARERC